MPTALDSATLARQQTRLPLRVNFSWALAGNLLYAGAQWGFLILLAKFLNPAAVGQFAFALAITAPTIIFANQGLTGLQATDARGEFTFRDYLRTRLLTTGVAYALIVGLTWVLRWPAVVLVVGASKATEALCDIKYGHYQQHDRMDRTARSMVLRGALSLACTAAALYLYRSVTWAAGGLVVANIAVLALYDFRQEIFSREQQAGNEEYQIHSREKRPAASRIKALLRQGFPLGLAAMLGSATASIPRYFLEHYGGSAVLGIFAALMYVLVGGRTLIAALAQSCVAQLSRLYVSGNDKAFDRLLLQQMAVGLALGLAGIFVSVVAGKLLLRILYRPEYAEYSAVFVLVMVAAAVNYLAEFANSGLLAVRAIAVQPAILALCAGLVLVLSFLLVPHYGIGGGTWAVLITGVVQFGVTLFCLMRKPFPAAQDGQL